MNRKIKMKRSSITTVLIYTVLLLVSLWGCRDPSSFLDPTGLTQLNSKTVFSDSARTMHYLASLYEGLYYWIAPIELDHNNGQWGCVTDVASTRWPSGHNMCEQVFDGLFGNLFFNHIKGDWNNFYKRIRQSNLFLQNVTLRNSPLSPGLTKRTRAEARFFRAYNYFMLMKGWGGVPIVGTNPFTLGKVGHNPPRNTWAECVHYVVSELNGIASELPLHYSGINYGRITKGAALALKAKVLLFAASPLYNGGSPARKKEVKKLTGYPTYKQSRWIKAFKALQAVVNLGVYHLVVDNQTRPGNGFYKVFLNRVNPEFILAYQDDPSESVENQLQPPSRGGKYHWYPTQELVDAFLMKNGKAPILGYNQDGSPIINLASGYDPQHPYQNRGARFYYTIIYNGAPYYDKRTGQKEPIWTYVGARPDGLRPLSSNDGTNTGYYDRKMMDESVVANGDATTTRSYPSISYAGILLDLAEAANHIGKTSLAMQQLIKIRHQAGIEPGPNGRYGLPVNPTQKKARELIHHARFIELTYEGHRFWDLRRWKEGKRIDGKHMHGMKITKHGDKFQYQRIKLRPRYFKPRLYYFPIPHHEIAVDPNLLQNPGW